MKVKNTGFKGLVLIQPSVHQDERGYFFEAYNKEAFSKIGITDTFVQDNHSYSRQGVLRGLHFQRPPFAQSKLVRVLKGVIWDVVVDLRYSETTFGKPYSVELSSESKAQLYVPRGFAHGFVVLSDFAEVIYKCDARYHKESEGGIIYNDPDLNIDWRANGSDIILSEKDSTLPQLKDLTLPSAW